MDSKIYVPINDTEDAHLGWAEMDISEICPQCRKIGCDCDEKEDKMDSKIYVPINDTEDAHLGWAEMDISEICPQCRKIGCDCDETL